MRDKKTYLERQKLWEAKKEIEKKQNEIEALKENMNKLHSETFNILRDL